MGERKVTLLRVKVMTSNDTKKRILDAAQGQSSHARLYLSQADFCADSSVRSGTEKTGEAISQVEAFSRHFVKVYEKRREGIRNTSLFACLLSGGTLLCLSVFESNKAT